MSDRGVGAEVFEFPFTAHRRAGRCRVEVRRSVLRTTVILSDDRAFGGIPVENAFERVATRLIGHPSLAGAAPSGIRWLERRDAFEWQGRGVPEDLYEVTMRWNPKLRRYESPRWKRAGREEFWTAAMDGVAHAERREESVAA
ncbi:MAG: hypothetical protein DI596_07855 [Azospira oryzae]|nr:MAG: hypothetical protein DI596_07855 [Azospira oryzae]PZP79750.1 MAG: hypothetical protein DI593_07855 [Azospira oryzae]